MICIPIQARSLKELREKASRAAPMADLLEIWIDHLPLTLSAREIVKACPKPVIAVNKPRREGGKWRGSEAARIKRLMEFAAAGAAYLDVGIDTESQLISKMKQLRKRSKMIMSYHNFRGTPSEKFLKRKIRRGMALGADIVKIATYAKKPVDNLKVLNLLISFKHPLAVMCMGENGIISRIAGPALGSRLTFAALDARHKTAPGQITVKEFKTVASLLNTHETSRR